MTTAAIQSHAGRGVAGRASLAVLSAGLLVSAAINFGWVLGAGAYLGGGFARSGASGKPIELAEDAVEMTAPMPKEVPLGRRDAKQAAITWLGVVENPVEGDAPESEVEQAAFTTRAGDAARTATMSPGAALPPGATPTREADAQREAVEVTPPAPAWVPESRSPTLVDETPVEAEPAPTQEIAAPAAQDPRVLPPASIEHDAPARDDEWHATGVETETGLPIGPVLMSGTPERVDGDADRAEPSRGAVDEVALREVMGPVRPIEAISAETGSDGAPVRVPATAGKAGAVSDRESTASKLKRALRVESKELNQPIAGQGLEIITVDPRFPASVRFTQLPRNPVVLIRFNATGKVAHVSFLRDEATGRVYDTGSRAVDEPLLNAIYQWRAKGERLAKLDAADRESTLEISMKILFREDESGERD